MSWRRKTDRHRLHPVALGALVIAGTIGLFYLAATKELPWSSGHELRLQFATANQIAPNAPVRIAGVNVGKVQEITDGPGPTATVVVEVDEDALPVREDATARIRPRTFLEGAFFVDIHPGSPAADELGDGGVIPLGQTSTPVQFDQVLTTLQRPVREQLRLAVQGLGTALDEGGPRAINATIPELDPLFTEGARVAEAAAGTAPHDLSRAIRSSSRVTAALEERRPALGRLVGSFSVVARALADRQRELAASISGLRTLVDEAPAGLDALANATPAARELVAELRPVVREAPAVVDPAVPLAGQLEAVLRPRRLPALVALAQPTVWDLAGLAPDLQTSLAGLRGPAQCVLDSALPTLMSEIDDGALSSGQPVYRELLYSLVGLSSATQNFDANGFSTRYFAGFDDQLVSTSLGSPSANLFGFASEPIIGSRPRKPAAPPEWRPDAPCTESGPVDLSAETGPGGFTTRSAAPVELTSPEASPQVEKMLRRLEGSP